MEKRPKITCQILLERDIFMKAAENAEQNASSSELSTKRHGEHTPTGIILRPEIPILYPYHFCKGQYTTSGKFCYTAWLIEIFLNRAFPFVQAYIEFRLVTMDVMYEKFGEDHASTPEERCDVYNEVASRIGYKKSSFYYLPPCGN